MEIKISDKMRRLQNMDDYQIQKICYIILLLGILFRLLYAAQVNYFYSPHDMGKLTDDISNVSHGHLGYMQYLFETKSFPDEYKGQFYHPPLFHIIGAVILGVFCEPAEIDRYRVAFENLQMLNVIFASIAIYYGYRILKKLGNMDWNLVFGTAFLSFCPAFYIIGGELNNDCLMTMLMVMSVYYTLCWLGEPVTKNIVKIALCIGLGMFTKSNMALIAIPIGLVFLYVFYTNRKEYMQYIKQYSIFVCICVPLGLCWNIYRTNKFGIDFNFVMNLGSEHSQYVGDEPFLSRIGLPSVSQLTTYITDMDRPSDFKNIWGQTFLTMNFDEGILKIDSSIGEKLAVLLLWTSIIVTLLLLYYVMRLFICKKADLCLKLLIPFGFVFIYLSFVKFSFDLAHVCTMNFRYIVILHVLILGSYIIYTKYENTNKLTTICIRSLIGIQSVLATLLYFLYAV